MMRDRTVNLLLTFMYTFVCQASHLTRTRSIENEHILEVNTVPIDLLLTIGRSVGQHRVEPRLSNDWEEAQVIYPVGQNGQVSVPTSQAF